MNDKERMRKEILATFTKDRRDQATRIAALNAIIESQKEDIEDVKRHLGEHIAGLESEVESQKEEIERLSHRDRVVSLTNETLGRYVNEGKEEIKQWKTHYDKLLERKRRLEKFVPADQIAVLDEGEK